MRSNEGDGAGGSLTLVDRRSGEGARSSSQANNGDL